MAGGLIRGGSNDISRPDGLTNSKRALGIAERTVLDIWLAWAGGGGEDSELALRL
jgi:hypothetical protein